VEETRRRSEIIKRRDATESFLSEIRSPAERAWWSMTSEQTRGPHTRSPCIDSPDTEPISHRMCLHARHDVIRLWRENQVHEAIRDIG